MGFMERNRYMNYDLCQLRGTRMNGIMEFFFFLLVSRANPYYLESYKTYFHTFPFLVHAGKKLTREEWGENTSESISMCRNGR